jgi:hypothetical protein
MDCPVKPLTDRREPRLNEHDATTGTQHVFRAPEERFDIGQVMKDVVGGDCVERTGVEANSEIASINNAIDPWPGNAITSCHVRQRGLEEASP